MRSSHRLRAAGLALAGLLPAALAAQRPARTAGPAAAAAAAAASAPITNVRYEIAFDSASAALKLIGVTMSFDVAGRAPVLLSLPVWTPGAYEVTNFAKSVIGFEPTEGGKALAWDKTDPDTWRLRPAGAGRVSIRYGFHADSLDNAMAWARPDFVFFNGTNLFFYAEGRGYDFPATVAVTTQPDWRVHTAMHRAAAAGHASASSASAPAAGFGEKNYHDLVDMPFFIGRFDLDSAVIDGKPHYLATYPAGAFQGAPRERIWKDLHGIVGAESRVFFGQPWTDYTTFMVFEPNNGSALEHQSSHLGVYDPQFMGTDILSSVTAHEMFHAWNVKRLRPVQMWPYEYSRWQPTPLLWVSEGITDYYADLALVRGQVVDSNAFAQLTQGKIEQVDAALPVALEDASLSTWIHPEDGTGYLYYPKGSLAGFMLDILIRDASGNRHSLDDVMRELFRADYQQGRGFTTEQFLATATRMAGGKSFADFYAKYVDGREPYPWDTVLPLAGMRLRTDTAQVPRVGISSQHDSTGERIMQVVPGSMAAEAGVQAGDLLVSIGDVRADSANWAAAYRERYGSAAGTALPIVVRRNDSTMTLSGTVRIVPVVTRAIAYDSTASTKAAAVRHGILTGK